MRVATDLPRLLPAVILGLWFLVTLLRQIDDERIGRLFQRFDVFHLFPAWRLFNRAPMDCRLWLRGRDRDGLVGAWRPLSHLPGRSLLIWSPGFRPASSLHVLVLGLVRHLLRRPDWVPTIAPWGQSSTFYGFLENHLGHLPGPPEEVERQFAITLGRTPLGEDGSGAFYRSPFFPRAPERDVAMAGTGGAAGRARAEPRGGPST